MKTTTKILLGAVLLVSTISSAQAVKVTSQKAPSSAVKATYYYLPEVESYYDIRNARYIYSRDGKWVSATKLPATYKSYTYSSGRKIILTDRSAPYKNFTSHKTKYHKHYKKTTKVRPGNSGNAPGHIKVQGKVTHSSSHSKKNSK